AAVGSMRTHMDLAIVGQGFFRVEGADGEIYYTENGQLHLNAEGLVVNSQGLPLADQIVVPEGSSNFVVGSDGTVTVTSAQGQQEELGQILLVNFVNPAGLEALG